MNNLVHVNGKLVRPDFNHIVSRGVTPADQATAQLVESLRNVAEGIAGELVAIHSTLRRIDRRLATHLPPREKSK